MMKRLVALVAATGLLVAACGDDDDDGEVSGTTGEAAVTSAAPTSAAPATSGGAPTTGGTPTSAAPATSAATATSEAAAPADVDPEGVINVAYDLAAASRGGFKWDPSAGSSPTTDMGIYGWVYGTLLRPNSEGELVPELAESVTAPDVNTVEIVVREGVTLSDGTPVDAAMVQEILTANLAKAENPAYRPGFYSAESVEVVEPNTVVVNVPDGTAASWADLYPSGVETVIVPPGTDFEAPIGAGPFTVAGYTAGQTMSLEKNPAYWDADAIKVAGIELINVPPDNPQAATGALNAGQVDWVRLNIAVIDAVSGDAEVVVQPDAEYNTQVLICKTTAPLDNVQVRQALNLATDRNAINDVVFAGQGEVAWDLWPDGHPLHNPELTDYYAYDTAAAQSLLAEAGAEGISVDIIPIPSAGAPEIVQILQQQWAQVGVTLNIVQTTDFIADLLVNNIAPLGLVPRSGGGRAKIDNFNGESIGNLCQYNDPELADLVDQLASVSDSSPEGVQLWQEIQAIIVEDALSIPLVFQPLASGINPTRLGDYGLLSYYTIAVPDMWQTYIKAS
jgi:peptide/nickel transport system substrate-binding protein